MDWKSFDATIPNFVVNWVFDFLIDQVDYSKFTLGSEIVEIGPAATRRMKNVFKWIKWNFINTKIMLPDGRMVRKTHGIPSGSYFTSLVGSLSNALICEFLMEI